MSASPFIIVAIDGGAATGKSSTARALGKRFHLLHVDTGSFYRTLCAVLLERKVTPDDPDTVRATLESLKLGTRVESGSARMEVDGAIVPEDAIRGPAVNSQVSRYAALPLVREALLAYQRGQADVAQAQGFRGLIMEGRDIGSVIFPNADFRFFLQADPAERVRRRAEEGRTDSISERDRLDTSRQVSPLKCPPGAVQVDSTHLSLEEVVAQLSTLIAARLEA